MLQIDIFETRDLDEIFMQIHPINYLNTANTRFITYSSNRNL